MLNPTQRARIMVMAFVFDAVGDPAKYAVRSLSDHGKPTWSMTGRIGNALAEMSISERTEFFEKFLNQLTTEEREEFRYYVGHGTFKE